MVSVGRLTLIQIDLFLLKREEQKQIANLSNTHKNMKYQNVKTTQNPQTIHQPPSMHFKDSTYLGPVANSQSNINHRLKCCNCGFELKRTLIIFGFLLFLIIGGGISLMKSEGIQLYQLYCFFAFFLYLFFMYF